MKINSKKIPWMFGEPVIDAINRAGLYVPSLCCDTSFMNNDSCCRLCMVEITMEGKTTIAPACTTITDEDMEINTMSETIQRARKTILQLMYSEAPGNEVIMDLMKKCGVEPNERIPQKGGRECILCRRCVNACKYWVNGAIDSMNRGINKEINTPYGRESDACLGCASCELVCPIHGIKTEDSEGHRKIWNNEFELLYCEECGKKLTTKQNFYDAYYADAPVLCNECSEEYRKRYRKKNDIYCD